MPINVAQIQAALGQAVQAVDELITGVGVPAAFTLHTGETFTINVVRRKKPDETITEGLQQKGFELTLLAKHWRANAAAPRHPEKGDQLTMAGRRHAVETSKLITTAGMDVSYVLRVVG
jgi:hypothetical protein